jgi:hypothetical protein
MLLHGAVLAMHQLLSGMMEYANASKIQLSGNIQANSWVSGLLTRSRKLLQCLLKQSKLGGARDDSMKMSPDVIRHPLSLYLTYCIAIQLSDEDLGNCV